MKSKSLIGKARLTRRRILGVVTVLVCVGSPILNAQDRFLAQQNDQLNQADDAAPEQLVRISQRQALDLVRARFPGNVISINEVQQRGALFYRVRLDNDGNVYTVYVNAVSGAITREQ